MNTPVSVAIATYNQCEFLREALSSVLEQNYSPLEIVVADDASTDGTPAMLEEFSHRHPGVFRIALGESNIGITANHNRAYLACTGDYVAWLDGDDLMLPGRISRQAALLDARPDVAICTCRTEVFHSETGRVLRVARSAPRRVREYGAARLVAGGNCIVSCSAMIRRSMAPRAGFDLRLEAFSDYLFLVETSLNGPIHALDETLARYRVHSGSFSGAGPADHEDIWLTLELLEQTYPALRSAVRQARAHLGYRRARARYSKGDLRGAREALLQSLANEIRPKSLVWLALLSFLSITRR